MPGRQFLRDKTPGRIEGPFFILVDRHEQVCRDLEVFYRPSRKTESFLDEGHRISDEARRAGIVEDDSVRILTR